MNIFSVFKKYIISLLLFIGLFFSIQNKAPVQANQLNELNGFVPSKQQLPEAITSFYSNITVNQDTSLTITEQIQYSTTLDKHGIYRYIPYVYNKDGKREVLQLSDIKVTDDQGIKIPYTKTTDSTNVTLKIGYPQKTFTGDQSYVITYTVERGVNQFENHTELYWDITGEGWQIPILESAATISSPHAPILEVACFSGTYGGNDGLCEFEQGENQTTFFYSETIEYGDNMTVVLKFPKESGLIFPSEFDLFMIWLRDNWVIFLGPLPLLSLFLYWNKNGRDYEFISQNVFDLDENKPQKKKGLFARAREPFVYEPLKDLTPGEAGALIDEKVDVQDIVAEILELARKKYITITTTKKKGFLAKGNDYTFTKVSASNEGLPEVQVYLYNELFKLGDTVTVAQLKGTFYRVIAQAKNKIETRLVGRNIYTRKPSVSKVLGVIYIIFTSFGIQFLSAFLVLSVGGSLLGVFSFFGIPLGILIAMNLGQKTAVGNNLWLQARGLRKTIQRGKWREEINEKHLFIENVLPFAVALGVVKNLTKDMKDLQIEPPEYLSSGNLNGLAAASLINDFSKEVASGLAYNPSSSSSSGGSGFSSGGGFSGGGGGGGGGGSW